MSLKELSSRISEIINKVLRSVVSIQTIAFTYDFLLQPIPLKGVGSGVIISPDGLIITNNHVVKNVTEVKVVLSDGRSFPANILARDPWRDLALLKIDVENLLPAKLGDSDSVNIGDLVFAIGNPLGLWRTPTVSLGIVSATGRTIAATETLILEDLIQTDAAINPGNSGGPLINVEGEVIGITTAIIPTAQGIGFAIPSNTVKHFLQMIKKYGKAVRAWIGVYVTELNQEIARHLRIPFVKGVVIIKVIPNSPADYVGLSPPDVICEVNGMPVSNAKELRKIIENNVDKGYVTLKVFSRGRFWETKVPIVIETS